jgi:hypothetical protein
VRRIGLALALLAAITVRSDATAAPSLVFTRIANQSTSIPGHLGLVPYFKDFTVPAVDNGTVAFQADGVLDFTGILTWDSGVLEVVADQTTEMPGMGTTKFQFFALPAIRGGTVAFVGASKPEFVFSKMGIYKTPVAGRAITKVADSNTTLPGA